jgi:hypothetical protein
MKRGRPPSAIRNERNRIALNRELWRKRIRLVSLRENSGEAGQLDLEKLFAMSRDELDHESKQLAANCEMPVGQLVWHVAGLLHTLENGLRYQLAQCDKRIGLLRKTKAGRAVDSRARLSQRKFLEALLERYAPQWKWRSEIARTKVAMDNDDARESAVSEQLAARRVRQIAKANRFVTAYDNPDLSRLNSFIRINVTDKTTWPTRRDLSLATAIPERQIEKIVNQSRPKSSEKATLPLRHVRTGRGRCPIRYAPRLVLAVVREFGGSVCCRRWTTDFVTSDSVVRPKARPFILNGLAHVKELNRHCAVLALRIVALS